MPRRFGGTIATTAALIVLVIGGVASAANPEDDEPAGRDQATATSNADRLMRQVEQLDDGDGVNVQEIAPPPVVTADAWIVYDDTANEPIAAHEPTTPRPIASLAKLMTALVVVERTQLDDMVTIPREVTPLPADASGMGVKPGQKWPAGDLLRAMLVYSANDAALALATHAGDGDVDAFVKLMNERAQELDLSDTEFASPTGFDTPGAANTSTPIDLAELTRTALKDPDIRAAVREDEIELQPPGGGATITLANRNPLIGSYAGADGVKTGFTAAAGYMLVAHHTDSETDGELIVVTAASSSAKTRARDAAALLDWARPLRTDALLIEGGTPLGTIPVVDSDRTVEVFACDDLVASVRAGQRLREQAIVPRAIAAPVKEGDEIGELRAIVSGETVGAVPACSADDVPVESRFEELRRHAADYQGAWHAGVNEVQDVWASVQERAS